MLARYLSGKARARYLTMHMVFNLYIIGVSPYYVVLQ